MLVCAVGTRVCSYCLGTSRPVLFSQQRFAGLLVDNGNQVGVAEPEPLELK